MANAIVHHAVKLVAENAASVSFLLYEGAAERDRHPLLDLLAQPNPRQEQAAFLEAVCTHLLLAGNAYVEAVTFDGQDGRQNESQVRELYALRPNRMRVVPGAEGWAEAYEYTAAGRTVRFDQSVALPPLESAAVAVDTHNAASRWNKALLDNAARPSGALAYAGPDNALLTDAQFERLQRELEGTYQGAANAGRPLLLEGGLDFGVPPMLLGIPGDNTYSNYQEANRVFWRGTVLPLANRIANALAQWLAPAFGDALRLAIDSDHIEALNADRAALWDRVTNAPFLTLNEMRLATGYGAVEGGDRFA